MKKLIRGLSAATLAACLCAGPVLAQSPGSFTAPGLAGAFIPYPHVDSAPIAQAPQDEFAPLWNSFYRADLSAQVLWDKLYLNANILDDYPPDLLEICVFDRNMVYFQNRISIHTPEDLRNLSQSLHNGARLCDLMEPPSIYDHYTAVLRSRETGEILGEGTLEHRSEFVDFQDDAFSVRPVECWGARYGGEILSAMGRPSCSGPSSCRLDLTDRLKSRLRDSGLDLENTRAFSVTLPYYGDGIVFDDGIRQFFLMQALYERPDTRLDGVAPMGDLTLVEGSTDIYRLTAPVERSSLQPGQLTPMSGFMADFDRIAAGGWYYTIHDGTLPPANTGKPVIYLYPEQETDVSVRLKFDGELTYTYPAYGGGWDVTAYPGGRIVNRSDGSEHYYLFWEGISDAEWTFDRGFCVPGADTEKFLRDALPRLGLTPREYNDFITYWVPKLQQNPYNLIKFADAEYERLASLTVTPKPDTIARIHMVYRPLDQPVDIPPQTLSGFDRKGFTVVEWGGTEAGAASRTQ